ncbi:MAG: Rne/Rng family ribonuclease [Gammaproteobacteria bacterium]|nr:Rne/Rng family ribonuclease [Gammaproteobacteria bacterium]
MLINAAHEDEWRVAIVEGNSLVDLDIELHNNEQIAANIYKGVVTRIEVSLEAAFVDYGGNRHGFLSVRDVAREYYPRGTGDHPSIKDVLHEGQEIIVQIDKEERGTKGAALTTFVSLAGCYLVLMPNNPNAGGISRRIERGDREALRDSLDALSIPEGMSVIIRTAGVNKSQEELQWDLDALVNLWKAIKDSSDDGGKAPFLIHQESDVIIRAVRDHLNADIDEIIIDQQKTFDRLKQYLERVRPDYTDKITLYQQKAPLFGYYHIESQTETVFQREVHLPSGGAIVIDQTEALTAIDINSARSTKGGDIEETAHTTNLEAADEIVKQLRLRDIGGLIVIDFIDMAESRNKRSVERRLREALSKDRARAQIGTISRFGLLEMSRQRLRSYEPRQLICPRCHGQGAIPSVKAFSSLLLRLLEESASQETTAQVHAQVPVEGATYLLNEKRQAIVELETRYNITLLIIANPYLDIPNYEINAITINEYATRYAQMPSYKRLSKPESDEAMTELLAAPTTIENKQNTPCVNMDLPETAAPHPKSKAARSGFWRRIIRILASKQEKSSKEDEGGDDDRSGRGEASPATTTRSSYDKDQRRRSSSRRSSGGGGSNRQRGGRGGSNRSNRSSSNRNNPRSSNYRGSSERNRDDATPSSRSNSRDNRGGRASSTRDRRSSGDRQQSDTSTSTRSPRRSSSDRSPRRDGGGTRDPRRNTSSSRRTSQITGTGTKAATSSNRYDYDEASAQKDFAKRELEREKNATVTKQPVKSETAEVKKPVPTVAPPVESKTTEKKKTKKSLPPPSFNSSLMEKGNQLQQVETVKPKRKATTAKKDRSEDNSGDGEQ